MTAPQHYSLIKKLYTSVSREALLDLAALQRLGISSQRAASYAKSGWLVRIAYGLYAFPQTEPTVGAAVAYLSGQIPGLHLGGRSALEGIAGSYQGPLVLWGDKRAVLAQWFSGRFPARYVHDRLFEPQSASSSVNSLVAVEPHCPGVVMSIPERALLELLYEVGCSDSLSMAQRAFVDAGTVCPLVTAELLQRCTSVKTVRLYLRLARQTRLLNVDELLERCHIRTGSARRWISRLKDGSTLSLGPYG